MKSSEEDCGGDYCRASEEYIVSWSDERCIEEVQCFLYTKLAGFGTSVSQTYIQINDFCQKSADHKDQQHV